MSLENPDQTQPFRAPQDEIQWGILLLTKQLQNRDLQEREQYLQELWEWARSTGGPPKPTKYPRLSGVRQTERTDLPS